MVADINAAPEEEIASDGGGEEPSKLKVFCLKTPLFVEILVDKI